MSDQESGQPITRLILENDRLQDEVSRLRGGMNAATRELLKIARELDLTIVGIGNTRHPLLENETFPHHHDQQIFAPDRNRDGWPAVWELARRAGIDQGCGNTGQRQADTSGLTRGVWIALMGGEWGRLA